MKHTCRNPNPIAGYTLVELMVSMAAASALLAGMASAIYIASLAADPPETLKAAQDAGEVVYEITDELQHAIYICERSDKMIQFVLSDLDGDASPDVVRYEWSGKEGDPLIRRVNFGKAVKLLENVHEFHLEYGIRKKEEEFDEGLIESSEVVLSELSSSNNLDDLTINGSSWPGQCIAASLPRNAVLWKPSKILLELRPYGLPLGQFLLQLRPATGGGTPTSDVLSEHTVSELVLALTGSSQEFSFSNVPRFGPSERVCIVLKHDTTDYSGQVRYEKSGVNLAGQGLLISSNQGASWTLQADKGLRHRLKGTYFTPSGKTHTVYRNYATGMRVTLRASADETARVYGQVPLLNTPELLSAYWRADFDTDPRLLDVNYDGKVDWTESLGSSSLSPSSMDSGVWQADLLDMVQLRTMPDFDFKSLTTIEVRSRCTSYNTVGYGAQLLVNLDRDGTTHATIFTSVRKELNGSQTARVYYKPSPLTQALIAEASDLSSDFVDIRVVVDPAADLAAVWINGIYRGTGRYVRYLGNRDRFVVLCPDQTDAEFDAVSVRVSE